MHIRRGVSSFVFLVLVSLLSAPAFAQTGADLLVKPWDPGQAFYSSTDGLVEAATHTKETDSTTQLSMFHAIGRWRIFPESRATTRLGYDFQYYEVNSHDTALPSHLWDVSIGFAQPVYEKNGWFVALTGAIGYAGNSLFSDPHAVYPAANVIVGKEFNKDRAILIALNYNGNRTFLPDTPIPGLAYADRATDYLTYVIGLPYSSITYEPVKGFQLEAGYTLVDTAEAKLAYQFTKHWALFGQYVDQLSPFHIDGAQKLDRMFLHTHTLEAGVRWNPTKLIRLSVSGGWAFGQEFSHGFDSRNLDPVRHLSDAPFVRAQAEVGF